MSARLEIRKAPPAPLLGVTLEFVVSAALLLAIVGGVVGLLGRHSVPHDGFSGGPGLGWPGASALAMGCFALLACTTVVLAHRHLRPVRFGLANHLTLARGAIACVITVIAIHPACQPALLGWTCTALGTAALLLDFADGQVARRRGTASRFGARFDMEMDALLIIALTIVVMRANLFGASEFIRGDLSVLAITLLLAGGLARYAFVALQQFMPALRTPLPPSQRRRALCAFHGIALVLLLAPPFSGFGNGAIASPFSSQLVALTCVAAAATVLASFAVDIKWLLTQSVRS